MTSKKIKQNAFEFLLYTLFGFGTMFINLSVYKFFNTAFGEAYYLISNIFAWICATIFAFITNKIWVFKSKCCEFHVILREGSEFFGCRFFSLAIEEIGLLLFIDVIQFSKITVDFNGLMIYGADIAKLILQLVVIAINYIFSKFFIFKTE